MIHTFFSTLKKTHPQHDIMHQLYSIPAKKTYIYNKKRQSLLVYTGKYEIVILKAVLITQLIFGLVALAIVYKNWGPLFYFLTVMMFLKLWSHFPFNKTCVFVNDMQRYMLLKRQPWKSNSGIQTCGELTSRNAVQALMLYYSELTKNSLFLQWLNILLRSILTVYYFG